MHVLATQPSVQQGAERGLRMGGRPGEVIVLETNTEGAWYFLCKRCFDVVAASVLLVLLSPVLLLIAALIKLGSSGPVIFKQERVGAKRRRFRGKTVWVVVTFPFYKFRSMFDGVDSSVHEAYIREFVQGRVQAREEKDVQFKLVKDSRVTPIGRFLRRTSLDELPQLANVLKGDMSLVGPRPVPLYEVAHYRSSDYDRLAAPPGITGLWQVQGRCRVPFEGMVRMDREYIEKASLWFDLKILLQTIPAVVSGRGAE